VAVANASTGKFIATTISEVGREFLKILSSDVEIISRE
jgi:hypothetical protein